MDFHAEAIEPRRDALVLGEEDAPIQVVEYLNLACPSAKAYFELAAEVLMPAVKEGRVVRYLKHFDKKKAPLERGNELYRYLDLSRPTETYALMEDIYKTQDQWKKMSADAFSTYLKDQGLEEQPDALERRARMLQEVEAAGVVEIPTCFVNGRPVRNADLTRRNLENWLAD